MNALTMADVIRIGASKREMPKPCPFCGADPPLAHKPMNGRFIVGCENDECDVNPQCSSDSLSEAWIIWNTRAKS